MESNSLLTFLLNAAWQIPVLAGVAYFAAKLMHNCPASHRHLVWVFALIASVVLPLLDFSRNTQLTLQELPPSLEVAVAENRVAKPDEAASGAVATPSVQIARSTAGLLAGGYVLWILLRLWQLGMSWKSLSRLKAAAEPAVLAEPLLGVWQRCLRQLQPGEAQLNAGDVPAPLTFGLRPATVVIPADLLEEKSEEVLTTAIGHELAHVKRQDFALNVLYDLLLLPVSFHPAAWFIAREIRRTREMACDELVTKRLIEPGLYARCLVTLASSAAEVSMPRYAMGVFDGDILERRIRRLLHPPAFAVRRARMLLAGSVCALALCAAALSGLALSAQAQSGFATEQKAAGEAFAAGNLASAVQHMENAVRLEPSNLDARLHLASLLMQMHSEQGAQPNSPVLVRARQQYQDALSYEPNLPKALQGLVMLELAAKRPAEAYGYAQRLLRINSDDPVALYTAGAAAWAVVFPEFMRMKQASGTPVEEYFIQDASVRAELKSKYLFDVEEGMQHLRRAIELSPQMDEAMAYLNLMYRLKAGMADNPVEARNLLAEADAWVGKALATKRQKAAEAAKTAESSPGGTKPVLVAGQTLLAPPPPPPPPRPVGENEMPSGDPPPVRAGGQPLPYWQVVGTSPTPVRVLFRQLKEKGFRAVLFRPGEEVYVLAGPYATEELLSKAKDELQAAGFRPVRSVR